MKLLLSITAIVEAVAGITLLLIPSVAAVALLGFLVAHYGRKWLESRL